MRSKIVKLGVLADPMVDAQVDLILANLMGTLGDRDTAPNTTGWGRGDVCYWRQWTSTVADGRVSCVVKYWNGKAVKTVTAT